MAGEPAGDVQEPVAEPFRFAAGELAGEQEALRPGEQVLRAAGELEPGGVRLDAAEGAVVEAGVLAAAEPDRRQSRRAWPRPAGKSLKRL